MIWRSEDHRNLALKSFTTFIVEYKSEVFRRNTTKYSCRHCDGSGVVVSPNAYKDPVEGYKMEDRVDCQSCNGTGESDEKSWRGFYKQEKASNDKRLKEKREIALVIKGALKKLTDAEKKALNLEYLSRKK